MRPDEAPQNSKDLIGASDFSDMPPPLRPKSEASARLSPGRLRRSTLITLRWGAVTGQLLAVLIVAFGLKYALPLAPALAVIAASALLNIALYFLAPLDRRVGDFEALAQLGFDVLQLGALLWLTGGMTNPFALLFIAPVATSATTLRPRVLFALIALTVFLSLFLLRFSLPLPWKLGEEFTLPLLYKSGYWIALMTGLAFTSLYAWRASQESRRMSDALAATEAVLAHEQKLAALGGLAAAAAHELGTPLATIQVTAKEMARELAANTPLGEDARLMVSQAQRCREILQQLARRGDEGDVIHDVIGVQALLDEVTEPFIGFGKSIEITLEGEAAQAPQLRRQAEMIYGLTNLVENAVDFARAKVQLIARWDANSLHIDVLDDGPGFDPALRARLGEPYVSSRPYRASPEGDQHSIGAAGLAAGGMGLGFFIAKTLLERTGAQMDFGNRKRNPGAFVRIRWPRERIIA